MLIFLYVKRFCFFLFFVSKIAFPTQPVFSHSQVYVTLKRTEYLTSWKVKMENCKSSLICLIISACLHIYFSVHLSLFISMHLSLFISIYLCLFKSILELFYLITNMPICVKWQKCDSRNILSNITADFLVSDKWKSSSKFEAFKSLWSICFYNLFSVTF